VEVLGLQIEREHIGKQRIERAGNIAHRVGAEVGRRAELFLVVDDERFGGHGGISLRVVLRCRCAPTACGSN
jgi:hypothetical protein